MVTGPSVVPVQLLLNLMRSCMNFLLRGAKSGMYVLENVVHVMMVFVHYELGFALSGMMYFADLVPHPMRTELERMTAAR